jgi:uncharacterized protein involved in exopolysaccharide biosynthesis
MNRTLEAVFRQPMRLLVLIILLPIVSVGIAYFIIPHTYTSITSLWALRRYEVIGATGPETDLLSTPSQTQATALSELLQTRAFALPVAKVTQLASSLHLDPSVQSDPQSLDDALFTEISKNVQIQSQGYNLFVISYTNTNPLVAQQVVEAVVQNYALQSQGFTVDEAQNLLQNYQTQLAQAQKAAQTAATAESQYLLAHPDLKTNTLINDPQYALLHQQTQQAQTALINIQTEIASLNQQIGAQGTGSDNLFKVIDPAVKPIKPVSRTRQFLIAGGIGLVIALVACAVYIVILVRRDHAIYAVIDLQKVTTYSVVMQLPRLTSPALSLLIRRPT